MIRNIYQSRECGQSVIEYAMLTAALLLATIGSLRLLGVDTTAAFCKAMQGMGVQTEGDCASIVDGVIFSDDFSDDMSKWRIERGKNWELSPDEEHLCAGPAGEHRAYAIDSEGSDYVISMDATLHQGKGYGVFFRASGEQVNGYTFQYDPGYGSGEFIIRKWVNGYEIWPPFARAKAPPDYQWHNVTRKVEVVAAGDTFTAKVDGQTVVTGQDDTYASGEIGLRTWGSNIACFDNVSVTVR